MLERLILDNLRTSKFVKLFKKLNRYIKIYI